MSSILDALRKLEGEKESQPETGGKKGDLFQPPPPRRGSRARGWVVGIALAATAVFAITFVLGRRERAGAERRAGQPQVMTAARGPVPAPGATALQRPNPAGGIPAAPGPRALGAPEKLPGGGARLDPAAQARREAILSQMRAVQERARAARENQATGQGGELRVPAISPMPVQPPALGVPVAAAPPVTAGTPVPSPAAVQPAGVSSQSSSHSSSQSSSQSSPAPQVASLPTPQPAPQLPSQPASQLTPQPAPQLPSQPASQLTPQPAPPSASQPTPPAAPPSVAPPTGPAQPSPVAPAPAVVASAPVTTPPAAINTPVPPAPLVPQAVVSPAAPPTDPTAVASPTAAPATRAPSTPPRVASAKSAPVRDLGLQREANDGVEPPPARIEKAKTPLLLVTEVTYHDVPERRSAYIQLGGARPRLVHEGESVDGFRVNQILAGAVEIEVGGGPVTLDVGESISLSVSAPDTH